MSIFLQLMSLSYKFLNESELYLNLKGSDAFVKKFESLEVREASSSHLKIYHEKQVKIVNMTLQRLQVLYRFLYELLVSNGQ